MNFRTLALSALTLAVLAPSAFAGSNAHSCVFRPMSDRDGTWCNPFAAAPVQKQVHGLKAAKSGSKTLQYYIDNDTRGSSMARN